MRKILAASLGALAMLAAAVGPALAQEVDGQSQGQGQGHGPLFGLSPEGKSAFKAAMQSVRRDGTQQQIQAIRAKELDIVDAPTLDTAALAQAMQQERSLAAGQQQRRQAAMLSAYQQMSPADRHIFVTNARALQGRIALLRAEHRGGPVASAR